MNHKKQEGEREGESNEAWHWLLPAAAPVSLEGRPLVQQLVVLARGSAACAQRQTTPDCVVVSCIEISASECSAIEDFPVSLEVSLSGSKEKLLTRTRTCACDKAQCLLLGIIVLALRIFDRAGQVVVIEMVLLNKRLAFRAEPLLMPRIALARGVPASTGQHPATQTGKAWRWAGSCNQAQHVIHGSGPSIAATAGETSNCFVAAFHPEADVDR